MSRARRRRGNINTNVLQLLLLCCVFSVRWVCLLSKQSSVCLSELSVTQRWVRTGPRGRDQCEKGEKFQSYKIHLHTTNLNWQKCIWSLHIAPKHCGNWLRVRHLLAPERCEIWTLSQDCSLNKVIRCPAHRKAWTPEEVQWMAPNQLD